MPVDPYNHKEANEPIRHETANEFWLIILTSYDLHEIENLAGEAQRIERNRQW